jgi:DNA-directed RNA polymerase subunit F
MDYDPYFPEGTIPYRYSQSVVETDKQQEEELEQQYKELDQNYQQNVEEQEPVNNVQEAFNVPIDAATKIAEDVANVGKAEPEWMLNQDKEPELQTTWGKTLSEIFQVAAPLVLIGLTKGKALKAMRNRGMLKSIPVNSFGDRAGNFAFDVGADVGWLGITRQGKTDNLSGMLSDLGVPVPDFVATKDSDTPEAKRIKQQLEAVGLGVFGSIIGGLFRAARGSESGQRFLDKLRPKNAESKEYVDKLKAKGGEVDPDPVVDQVVRDDKLRGDADSELALKRLVDNGGEIPSEPDKYIQSGLFDESERIPKAVPPEGLVEALADNAKIAATPGGNGRPQRFMTDAAVEAVTGGDLGKRTLIRGIEQQIKEFGSKNIDFDIEGRWMNNKELIALVERIYPDMLGLDVDELKQVFNFDTVTLPDGKKIQILDTVSESVALKLSKQVLKEMSPDRMRASALAQSSLANDISDSATAASVVGKELDTDEVYNKLMDKLEVLIYENSLAGSYTGWRLNARKVGLGITEEFNMANAKKVAAEKAAAVRKLANDIREIETRNPQLASKLREVWDVTDGSITSIVQLEQAIKDAMKGRRLIKNFGYASPAVMVEAIFSLFYAFKLSSLYTPMKAIANNTASFIMQPASQVLGGKDARIAWAEAASGLMDDMRVIGTLMGERFKKVQSLPVGELNRTDYQERVVRQSEIIEAAAALAEDSGDIPMLIKTNFARMMLALGNTKLFRLSTNMMEAGDAALNVGLVLRDKRAKLIAAKVAENGKITGKEIEDINQWLRSNGEVYARGALDIDGDFKPFDPALKFQGGELAMNLDTQGTRQLGGALNNFPILKTFVLFPKTALNSMSFLNKFSPTSQDLFRVNTLKDPKQIAEFLETKGITFTEANWIAFKQQTRGRVVIGSSLMSYAFISAATGNMTGNGKYDKTLNRMNKDLAEEPVRSWRLGPGMPWISYDGIEPISTLLSTAVDLANNYDTLGKARFEDIGSKLMYIFADNVTNKTFMQGLRPLFDFMSGRPGSIESYFANLGSISAITHLSRTIDPAYREVENDFLSQLRNKWGILDQLGIGSPLPYDYNVVTGQKVEPLNFFGSSIIPVRLSKAQTKAQEILTEIDFPINAAISTIDGIELNAEQRSFVKKTIGERGRFAKEIVRLYNSKRGQMELRKFREERAAGVPSKAGQDQWFVRKDRYRDWKDSWLVSEITKVLTQEVNQAKKELMATDRTILDEKNKNYKTKRDTQSSKFPRPLLDIN